MPKFLEAKLKKQYPNNPNAVYGTMNAIGAMKGNKETAKGKAMQAKHDKDMGKKRMKGFQTEAYNNGRKTSMWRKGQHD
jgi:hypothetical protein